MTDADANTSESYSRIESLDGDDTDDEEWVEIDWIQLEGDGCAICECPNESVTPDDCECPYHTFLRSTNEEENQVALKSQDDNQVDQIPINNSDESDDVSIITDSEIEPNILTKNFSELYRFKGKICGPLKMLDGQKAESVQVNSSYNTIVCCTLTFCTIGLLALAASRICSVANTCSISNEIDFDTIKSEADNLIAKCKDLNEVKRVLEQIKVSMPWSKKFCKNEKKMLNKKEFKKPFKLLDINSFNSTSNMLQQLKTSLNTLSVAVNEINNTNEILEMKMYQTQNIISELNTFQNIMKDLVTKLKDLDKPVETKFLQNYNDEINRVSQSLLSHLLESVYELTINMYNKFDKIKYKMSKRLCCTRNTLPGGQNFLADLDKNNSFLNSCNEILNIQCNTFNKTKGKYKKKKHDANQKHKKWKNTKKEKITVPKTEQKLSWKDVVVKKPKNDDHLIYMEYELARVSNFEQKSSDKNCDTLSESSLSRNECLVQPSSWIYPEIESFHTNFDISGLNVKELHSDALYNTAIANNDTENKKALSLRQTLNLSQERDRNATVHDNLESDSLKSNIFSTQEEESESRKSRETYSTDTLDISDSSQGTSENGSDNNEKKKKKFEDSESYKKDSKYKEKKSSKSEKTKNKKKTVKFDKSSKYQNKENIYYKILDADWQFQRSRAREKQRFHEDVLNHLGDVTNWYFGRAKLRKKAREISGSEESGGISDWDSSEKEFIDDWLERKDMNSRKHNNGKSSAKTVVNRLHRKNILQMKRL